MSGSMTERPTHITPLARMQTQEPKEKPLICLRIKLSENSYVSANVYKDDNASTVADRVFRHANIRGLTNEKDKKKQLAIFIESKVNAYIATLNEEMSRELKEIKKQ